MKITVLTGCDDQIAHLQNITIIPVQEYCARHGYELVVKKFRQDSRPSSWHKLPYIEQCFQNGSDYVLWIDTDATIVNQNIKLETLIKPDKQFYYARNFIDINAGVLLFQRTPEMSKFLINLWNRTEYIHHYWWENTAMMASLYEGYPDPAICEILDEHIFNCPWYWSGCLVHHMWGCSTAERVRAFSKIVANRPKFS